MSEVRFQRVFIFVIAQLPASIKKKVQRAVKAWLAAPSGPAIHSHQENAPTPAS